MSKRIALLSEIGNLIDPEGNMVTIRTFITPHPLNKDEEPRYYKSCRSSNFPKDLEIHCASEGCADMWLQLSNNTDIFIEPGDIKPKA